MESVLTFHDNKLGKLHVLYAYKGDACTLETRRRFVTERGKKKRESRNLNPGLTVWVITKWATKCERERIFQTGLEEN